MSIITILVVIVVVGVLLWAAESLPMSPPVRRILQVVVVVALVIWLLQAFGLLGSIRGFNLR
jgi:type IV secretory pathway TrbL component